MEWKINTIFFHIAIAYEKEINLVNELKLRNRVARKWLADVKQVFQNS